MKKVVTALAMMAIVVAVSVVVASRVYASGGAKHASAVVRNAEGHVIGSAHFTEDAAGRVHVNVHVKGISAGQHGIHLHTVGTCTPPFAAAGGHFNPRGREHGHRNENGPHAGDLPNLIVNKAGVGHLNTTTELVTLSSGLTSLFDADGTSLIVHANPDDQQTHPTGNSGDRIACGVIERN